jgi:hypothetical protein
MFWGKKSESIFKQLKDITNGKTWSKSSYNGYWN